MEHDGPQSIQLTAVQSRSDILPAYVGTPIETLLASHNLGEDFAQSSAPEMVIATCMDHRVVLRLPTQFAFILRTAGAATDPVIFNIACAMALTPVRTIAVIGHSDCAMVNIARHLESFVQTVTNIGTMDEDEARRIFEEGAGSFGIDDPALQTVRQCESLGKVFPGAMVCPLFFDVADGRLYQIS